MRPVLDASMRPDGRDYPDSLTEIPEGAARLAVADCCDVMTVARPYSRAMAPQDALAECRSLGSAQFTAEAWLHWRQMPCNR